MKILCPIDFSESSLNAFEYAVKLASTLGASITLLNVLTEEDLIELIRSEKIDKEIQSFQNWATEMLQNVCDSVTKNNKNSVTSCNYIIKQGTLVDNIIKISKENHYDYIIMGTKGVSNLKEVYFGSNTIKAIKKAPCPIFCIPETYQWSPLKKIMYACDYNEDDKNALTNLVSLAHQFDASIDIVHVSEDKNSLDNLAFIEYQNEIKTYLDYDKIIFYSELYDDVVMGLNHYYVENNCNLLTMLTKQRDWLEQLLHKSTTQRVASYSNFPILVYKF